MRWLALFGIVGCVACTRANPSYGSGDSSGNSGDDGGPGPNDDAPTDASVSASDDAVTDSAPTEDSSPTDPTLDGTGAQRPCCIAHHGLGCDEPTVEGCVCQLHAECCDSDWNDTCVEKARVHCGAACGAVDDGTTGTGGTTASEETSAVSDSMGEASTGAGTTMMGGSSSTGSTVDDCCALGADMAGCGNPVTEDCVCITLGFGNCCKEIWDENCVNTAIKMCPGACGG